MILMAVLSRWVGTGTPDDPYMIELAQHYAGAAVRDWVGHPRVPTVPNVVLARLWCAPEIDAAIRADARYGGLLLWRWREGAAGSWERTGVIDADAAAALRAGLMRLGLSGAAALAIAGAAEGRTRAEVCEAVIARIRALASAR